MPEGHTTHALAERLGRAFSGTVVSVSSPQGRFEDGAALLDALALVGASAWGKHLFVQFEGERWLNVHLGLIGKFSVKRHLVDPGPGAGPDTHPQIPGMPHGHVPVEGQVRLRLLNDTWVGDLRGPTVCAVVTPEKVDEIQARLGPDPLRTDADPDFALRRIMRSTKPIAELLMDQAVLAGVGNVYRCEVLFRHRVDPFRPGREIRPATWQAILDDLTRLMPLGVAFGQILTMDDQVADALAEVADGSAAAHTEAVTGARLGDRFERRFYLYKRTGEPCRTCGSTVRTQLMAGRNLFWCGRCQRRR
ncbi:MAG TPA: DNA-formamidopyrimidine glycosylase family protein [Dermatophilaceae bacterium]|nr:DNA-formamidopyrimidine glycosylase family protein [Dermatophilaceae bacterium]